MRVAAFTKLMAAPPPPPPPTAPPKERSGLPTAGGILNIIGGIIAIVIWLWMLTIFLAGMALAEEAGGEFTGLFGLGAICLVLPIIGGIFALLGGIMALKRKNWGLALVGSIIGLIFGGGIFCLIALILIAISRKEFA
jgi:hypothetical protein